MTIYRVIKRYTNGLVGVSMKLMIKFSEIGLMNIRTS